MLIKHRAGAERNHRVGEGDVLALKLLDVAHHLGLGVVGVENLLGENRSLALHIEGSGGHFGAAFPASEDLSYGSGFGAV